MRHAGTSASEQEFPFADIVGEGGRVFELSSGLTVPTEFGEKIVADYGQQIARGLVRIAAPALPRAQCALGAVTPGSPSTHETVHFRLVWREDRQNATEEERAGDFRREPAEEPEGERDAGAAREDRRQVVKMS